MAERPQIERPQNVTLESLISTATVTVARTWEEQRLGPRLRVPPRIWVGIWIDFDNFGGPQGGGPVGGGVAGPG